jgi:hypothetical protein
LAELTVQNGNSEDGISKPGYLWTKPKHFIFTERHSPDFIPATDEKKRPTKM